MTIEVTDAMIQEIHSRIDIYCRDSSEGIREGLRAVLAEVEQKLSGEYLIWSRSGSAWWGPDGHGYTTDMMCAGRHELAEAQRLALGGKLEDGSPKDVIVKAPEIGLIGDPRLMSEMRDRICQATAAAKQSLTLEEKA